MILQGCIARPPLPPTLERFGSAPQASDTDEVGPLLALGWSDDVLGTSTTASPPDGRPDYRFRVRISGEVEGLVLTSSDPSGRGVGWFAWDTLLSSPFPPSIGLAQFQDGLPTISLAVFDVDGHRLNPQVTLPRTHFDGRWISLAVPDPEQLALKAGTYVTLFVLRPGGHMQRTTTLIL